MVSVDALDSHLAPLAAISIKALSACQASCLPLVGDGAWHTWRGGRLRLVFSSQGLRSLRGHTRVPAASSSQSCLAWSLSKVLTSIPDHPRTFWNGHLNHGTAGNNMGMNAIHSKPKPNSTKTSATMELEPPSLSLRYLLKPLISWPSHSDHLPNCQTKNLPDDRQQGAVWVVDANSLGFCWASILHQLLSKREENAIGEEILEWGSISSTSTALHFISLSSGLGNIPICIKTGFQRQSSWETNYSSQPRSTFCAILSLKSFAVNIWSWFFVMNEYVLPKF